MNLVIAITIYLIGWVLSVRPALRRHMLRRTCINHRLGKDCSCRSDYPRYGEGAKAVRGAISDRNGRDAAWAIFEASWWLWRLLVLWFVFLLRIMGEAIGSVTLAGRLTMPEMERHEQERTAEIERLSRQTSAEVPAEVVYANGGYSGGPIHTPTDLATPSAYVYWDPAARALYLKRMRA